MRIHPLTLLPLLCLSLPLPLPAQTPAVPDFPAETAAPQPPPPAPTPTLAEAQTTLAAFLQRLHAAGFTCPNPAPKILVEDVPSFGQYDDETNTLRISDWSLLQPEERSGFFLLAGGPDAKEADARALFDLAAHRWIFIHELGHWWQNCNKAINQKNPWKMEFDADRVSLAYWREADPTVVSRMVPIFQRVVSTYHNPTPAGQDTTAYFNAHYQELGPTPAYRWYQSQMNVVAEQERPILTFAQILTAIQATATR